MELWMLRLAGQGAGWDEDWQRLAGLGGLARAAPL
jgi:hypothetical protein